ncbi:MAG: AhpC/TSA family protein [Phycisphaerales bacterium]|nr:AhpC/TSA family protein [Phycisphaerales bacterium]MCB9836025.1 AhpC/TSA family protein [Phycisphaera sp.]
MPAPMTRFEALRHRTVELAGMAALGVAVCTCPAQAQNSTKDKTQPAAKDTAHDTEQGPLAKELAALSAQFAEKADPEMLKTFTEAIDRLAESGILENVKAKGDKAPEFELTDANGNTVSFKELLAEGPVVLTFYRGGWCPYCNIQLRAYQDNLDEIQALGASLVAITPEMPDNSLETSEKNKLGFTVLSDPGNKVADMFGLRYEIDPVLAERFGPMLEGYNGDDSHTLPLTATYVVNTDGTIKFSYVTADYKLRAEPSDVLKALKHVKMGH